MYEKGRDRAPPASTRHEGQDCQHGADRCATRQALSRSFNDPWFMCWRTYFRTRRCHYIHVERLDLPLPFRGPRKNALTRCCRARNFSPRDFSMCSSSGGMPETCTSNQYIWIGASSDSQLHDDAVIAISGHAHQNSHSKK